MDMMKQQFMPASLVQTITTKDGGVVLLDLQTDRFVGLDQMSALIWTLLIAGSTPQEVVRSLAERYTIETEELLQSDVTQFVQTMEAQQLLLPLHGASTTKGSGPSRPHALRFLRNWPIVIIPLIRIVCLKRELSEWVEAWLLLHWIHASLLRGSLIDLTRRWQTYSLGKTVSAEDVTVRRLARHVQSAAAWHLFKAVCLHQNLALGFLLRRRALQADLVIGVSTYPFFAHAWLISGTEVIQWQAGLGPGAPIQRLEGLSVIFCTEWFRNECANHGGDV